MQGFFAEDLGKMLLPAFIFETQSSGWAGTVFHGRLFPALFWCLGKRMIPGNMPENKNKFTNVYI
jgi:hypothetical protein